jgi:hypothetical protein
MFVGALHCSRSPPWHGPPQLLGSITGLKQTTAFGMIAHLYHDCIKAGSMALHRSLSWLTRVLSTLPIPQLLGPGASAR